MPKIFEALIEPDLHCKTGKVYDESVDSTLPPFMMTEVTLWEVEGVNFWNSTDPPRTVTEPAKSD